jgi:hypothetical protein
MRKLLLGLLLATGVVAAAACTNQPREMQFVDHFDGNLFPGHGWAFAGTTPVLDTTGGAPAPSMTWIACAGTGSLAQIDETFDARYTLDARADYEVYGSAASPQTGVVFHAYGDLGDDAAVSILPPPTGQLAFELDGAVTTVPLPVGPAFHHLELQVDGAGNAAWAFDGSVAAFNAPLASGFWIVEFLCGEGNGSPGRVPVLIDNVSVTADNSP